MLVVGINTLLSRHYLFQCVLFIGFSNIVEADETIGRAADQSVRVHTTKLNLYNIIRMGFGVITQQFFLSRRSQIPETDADIFLALQFGSSSDQVIIVVTRNREKLVLINTPVQLKGFLLRRSNVPAEHEILVRRSEYGMRGDVSELNRADLNRGRRLIDVERIRRRRERSDVFQCRRIEQLNGGRNCEYSYLSTIAVERQVNGKAFLGFR